MIVLLRQSILLEDHHFQHRPSRLQMGLIIAVDAGEITLLGLPQLFRVGVVFLQQGGERVERFAGQPQIAVDAVVDVKGKTVDVTEPRRP